MSIAIFCIASVVVMILLQKQFDRRQREITLDPYEALRAGSIGTKGRGRKKAAETKKTRKGRKTTGRRIKRNIIKDKEVLEKLEKLKETQQRIWKEEAQEEAAAKKQTRQSETRQEETRQEKDTEKTRDRIEISIEKNEQSESEKEAKEMLVISSADGTDRIERVIYNNHMEELYKKEEKQNQRYTPQEWDSKVTYDTYTDLSETTYQIGQVDNIFKELDEIMNFIKKPVSDFKPEAQEKNKTKNLPVNKESKVQDSLSSTLDDVDKILAQLQNQIKHQGNASETTGTPQSYQPSMETDDELARIKMWKKLLGFNQ